jgi:dienelactone hydrolase
MNRIALAACFYSSIISTSALAQNLKEKLDVKTFTCKGAWGAKGCYPHNMSVDLYIPPTKDILPLVILQHGSGGVTSAVRNKIQLLNNNNYAVVVIDGFTSRGINKSHFDYSGTSLKGGNARTMTLDTLSVIKTLKNDKRINVQKSAIVGFSQGGSVAYWTKAQTFLDVHASPLLGSFDMPKVAISMYGCHGEFNESFSFNNLPVEIIIGDKDPALKKCNEFKNRLSKSQSSAVKITTLPNAHHSFDENFAVSNWTKNQNTNNCYVILKQDGSAENPFIKKIYARKTYSYSDSAKDCTKMGEIAGNNGAPNIGDRPLLSVLKFYLD